jgi:hypothetical protein
VKKSIEDFLQLKQQQEQQKEEIKCILQQQLKQEGVFNNNNNSYVYNDCSGLDICKLSYLF